MVVKTAMNTEVGHIANMLTNSEKNETPLQVQLAKTAKYLSILVLIIAIIIFIAEFLNVEL
jgi:Ca2+-transporting ATPase